MSTLESFRQLPAAMRRDAPQSANDEPHLLSYGAIGLTAVAFALVIAGFAPALAVADALWWAAMPAILALALVAPRLSLQAPLVNRWMLGYAGLWGFLMAPILAAMLTPNAMLAAGTVVVLAAALGLVGHRRVRRSANAWLMARIFGLGAITLIVAMFVQELMQVDRALPL